MTDDYSPSTLPESVRTGIALLHASAYAGLLGGVLFIVGPLVLWLVKRDEHPAYDAAGKEAVNFHLTMLLVGLIGGILTVIGIGLVVLLIVGLLSLVCPAVAAVRASNGEAFRYPSTIRFIK